MVYADRYYDPQLTCMFEPCFELDNYTGYIIYVVYPRVLLVTSTPDELLTILTMILPLTAGKIPCLDGWWLDPGRHKLAMNFTTTGIRNEALWVWRNPMYWSWIPM